MQDVLLHGYRTNRKDDDGSALGVANFDPIAVSGFVERAVSHQGQSILLPPLPRLRNTRKRLSDVVLEDRLIASHVEKVCAHGRLYQPAAFIIKQCLGESNELSTKSEAAKLACDQVGQPHGGDVGTGVIASGRCPGAQSTGVKFDSHHSVPSFVMTYVSTPPIDRSSLAANASASSIVEKVRS